MPTVTARGTNGNATAATTLTCTPGSNMAAGSMGVLSLALDNSGSAGATAVAPAGPVTDTAGNIWTRRLTGLFDNGAASAGVEIAVYTSTLTVAFATSNNFSLNFGTSTTAKAYAFWEVVPTTGYTMLFDATANGTGATSAAPTVTTSSRAVNNVVIGLCGAESANTFVGDADTTNGTWTTQQATGFGTGTSGMSITTQAKVITTAGTQTYNPTLTSVDTMIGWIALREQINTGWFAPFFL